MPSFPTACPFQATWSRSSWSKWPTSGPSAAGCSCQRLHTTFLPLLPLLLLRFRPLRHAWQRRRTRRTASGKACESSRPTSADQQLGWYILIALSLRASVTSILVLNPGCQHFASSCGNVVSLSSLPLFSPHSEPVYLCRFKLLEHQLHFHTANQVGFPKACHHSYHRSKTPLNRSL